MSKKTAAQSQKFYLKKKSHYSITDISQFDQDHSFKFSLNSSKCRRFTSDKIYTGQGLFILRIKTFEECREIEIELKFKERHIKSSPICVKEIFPENCKCRRVIDMVLVDLNCEAENDQIREDLKAFPTVNFTKYRDYVHRNYENSRSAALCNYVVKSGRIYRKCYGEYVGFKMFIDRMLSHLSNKVKLPDFEFFMNLGDWPLMRKQARDDVIMPIFSWCGSTDSHDIVIPTYDLTESTLNMLQRSVLDIFSVQREKWKWSEKVKSL